jgi:succinate dehydrogenase/fumarate reductase flavoprotein subunit
MSNHPEIAAQNWDIIVVGAGAAGMTAACVAAVEGCSVLLLEQADVVGGTTAISGGMVWIPGNHKAAQAGRPDSLAAAREYLTATVPSSEPARLEAFLNHGDEAIRYLEAHTALRLQPVTTYPDYYPDLAGATLGGRVLEPTPLDASKLGVDFQRLRDPLPEFMLLGGMMISRQDIPHLRRITRSWRSAWHVARLLARYVVQRLRYRRGTTLYLGNALAGRLLQSACQLGVHVQTGVAVDKLVQEHGRVVGVATTQSGRLVTLRARRGVILSTGGLSHDAALRAQFVPTSAGTLSATVQPAQGSRGAQLALSAGAQLSPATHAGAFWVPASTFTRSDGSVCVFPHTVTDRAKPGLVAVGSDGQRFVNEAVSYHEFVRAQLANPDRAIPAFLLCDRRFLWKYGLGRIKPFSWSVQTAVREGHLTQADTIADLARHLGLPADALATTLAHYNQHARLGKDPLFGRGGNAYQRHLGDAEQQPNPCVAPMEHAPFYAVKVWPADLGMSSGIRTDAQARVLGAGDHPIPGLYACGNDMASVMEGAYPGPGITLGPALTFAYLAARHAAQADTGSHPLSKQDQA